MEELLREVALSERRKKQMDSFIETITQLLQAVPHSPEVEVCRRCVTYGCRDMILFIWFSANLFTETLNHIIYFYLFR